MTPALRLRTIIALLTLLTPATALDATLQIFKESPGLYYDHIEEAQLRNTEWRILPYINLQEADQNLETVKNMPSYLWIFVKAMNIRIGSTSPIARKLPAT
jgi:hypothetical protein